MVSSDENISLMCSLRKQFLSENDKYTRQIDRFISYLDENQLADKIAQINRNVLEAFIGDCVEKNIIGAENTLRSYLEAIKAFYMFIIKMGYSKETIVPVHEYTEFVNSQSEKYSLKSAVEREWLDSTMIKNILSELDLYLKTAIYEECGIQEKGRYMQRLILRIYLKLCLIAPAKKKVLYHLRVSDFFDNFRMVRIHDVKIRIPNGLRRDILDTLDFFQNHDIGNGDKICRKNKINPKDNFFIWLCEACGLKDQQEQGTYLNACFAVFLKERNLIEIADDKNTYPVELVSNTTIYNLVKQGINPFYISKISGLAISSLERKYYNKIGNPEIKSDIDTIINDHVSNCEYYHYI